MSTLAEGVYFVRSLATKTVVTADSSSPNPKLVGYRYSFDDIDQQLFSVKLVGKGSTYVITHNKTGRVFDLEGANSADGTPIILYSLHWGDNQLWRITPSEGAYKIQSVSSGKLVDLTGGEAKDNTPIINYHANGGRNQLWEFKRVAHYVS